MSILSELPVKFLDDVEDLLGLVGPSVARLLRDYQVDVDVGVDEVAVERAAHCSLDAHQAVLLQG